MKGPLESATALSSFLKENSLATSDTMAGGRGGEGEASTPPLGVCGLATTEREKEGEEGLGGAALGSKQEWRGWPPENGQSHLCDFPRRGLYLAPGRPMFPGFCRNM